MTPTKLIKTPIKHPFSKMIKLPLFIKKSQPSATTRRGLRCRRQWRGAQPAPTGRSWPTWSSWTEITVCSSSILEDGWSSQAWDNMSTNGRRIRPEWGTGGCGGIKKVTSAPTTSMPTTPSSTRTARLGTMRLISRVGWPMYSERWRSTSRARR